jgi:uncharacterized protein
MFADAEQRSTLLHVAAASGRDTAVLGYLLQHGADIDAVDNSGETALHAAARTGSDAAVELLLQRGADTAVANAAGATALWCVGAQLTKMWLFIEHGASPSAADSQGCSLLMWALMHESLDDAARLIESGASVTTADSRGFTALHHAAHCFDSAAAVALLVQHGAAVEVCDCEARTPLMIAACSGSSNCCAALIAAGANVLHSDARGFTALHVAAMTGGAELVQVLLAAGADCVMNNQAESCACCGSLTTLMLAQVPAVVKLLLAAGADATKTTSTSNTCLHVAAAHDYPVPVICLLIKAGVKIGAVNGARRTAVQVADSKGYRMIAALLSRAAQD